jgi:protein-disulfide isomerase
MNRHNVWLTITLTIVSVVPAIGEPIGCSVTIDQPQKQKLVAYVRTKLDLPRSATLDLKKTDAVGDTCYQRLTFQVAATATTRELVLYLSPNGRFLTSDLFDTTRDPAEEERQRRDALMNGLTVGNVPTMGPENAPVTIVAFSDFQCPYCRGFADILNQVLPSEKDHIRVVFHHFPLTGHSWARMAAQGSACAQLQSSRAFWAMHNKLFSAQKEITIANIKTKLVEYARSDKDLDLVAFQTCLDNDLSLGLVLRDMNLASAYEVTGTPTIFLNGRLLSGVRDATQLRTLLREAETDKRDGRAESKDAHAQGTYVGEEQ